MNGNWKKLIASFKATDRFLLFLTETVKEKILKRKWKILGPKKRSMHFTVSPQCKWIWAIIAMFKKFYTM
uniref:Uncharacterized protein n=1 Tax=Globodera rostochiensis TaxID=31243 RepID=A0A914IC28_GLORO